MSGFKRRGGESENGGKGVNDLISPSAMVALFKNWNNVEIKKNIFDLSNPWNIRETKVKILYCRFRFGLVIAINTYSR